MSIKNHLSTKKVAAGALIALSGFVPQIASTPAFAASASISVTGSFVTGIALGAGNDVKFGKVATTNVNGKVGVDAAAGTIGVTNNAIAAGGTPQAGSFTYTIVNTTPAVDVSVQGMGTFTFTADSAGGVTKTGGPVSLKSVILNGLGATDITLTPSIAGTKGIEAAYAATGTTGTINVGANIAFTANPTIGAFAVPITLTIAY